MKTTLSVSLFILLSILFSGGMPLKQYRLSKELDELRKHKISYKYLDNQTIELDQAWSGFHRVKTLREPDEATIRAYAQAHDIPVLEIDPTTIDTSKYTGWYTYWKSIPLANGFSAPILINDLDRNGKPEFYGVHCEYSLDYEDRIYEIDTTGRVKLLHTYKPYTGIATQFSDIDHNSLMELVHFYGDTAYIYEQSTWNSLPISPKFKFAKYESSGAIFTHEVVAEMDNDSLTDFLFRGSEPESVATGYKTYVGEYDPGINNFKKVWSTVLWPNESAIGGYDVGDYDGDGKMNFLASGMNGQVWVVENTGDNAYAVSWKDSLPLVNLFYQTSGDVDHDGKREFFVGATMASGNWTMAYEADSNDHYSPTFLIHLLSGSSFSEPTYMTRDVDGDGIPELIILSGADLFIFKSNADNAYTLWYYKQTSATELVEGIQFYDFAKDGKLGYIVSTDSTIENTWLLLHSHIYLPTGITGVGTNPEPHLPAEYRLLQNYPNPFNPATVISYTVPVMGQVTIKVFNIEGREMTTLVKGTKEPGSYSVTWNAGNAPSGVYFCRMQGEKYTSTIKMILIK